MEEDFNGFQNYVIYKLTKKYDIDTNEAYLFFNEILKRRKVEEFFNKIDMFPTFNQMKKYFIEGVY